MDIPKGLNDINDGHVLLLKKSLYGLKQSPRCWNIKFTNFMLKHSFTQSENDLCLFTKVIRSEMLIIGVYVDDCVIAGPSKLVIEFKELMIKSWKMHDLEQLNYLLGLKVEFSDKGISLSQKTYK